jgi:hypothetical protein
MKTIVNDIKTDFKRVFVEGNANNHQMLVVYLILTVPSLVALFSVCGIVVK